MVLRDGSTIRFHNWSRSEDRFKAFGLKLIWLIGWKAWRHGHGVAYFYHSHRQSTSPSQTDQIFMKQLVERWPGVGHLIFTPSGDASVFHVIGEE